MDVYDAIVKRRTTYSFLDKEVSEETIVTLITSAVKSPVAGGIREYEFIIVTKPELKSRISKLSLTPNIDSAPFMIIVVCDKSKIDAAFDESDSETFCVENAALAIENLLLMATSYGLGSAWVATLQQNELKKLLEIPEKYIVRGVIPIGYPKSVEPSKSNTVRTDISKIVHIEKFNNNAE
ncbi:MAG: nitroreductase family protein [Candidatus Parvarchaeota archaeon]|jgi:nitroreductase|nr:nitroreductase family protein [Candidatus Parvarchaeota archaeon]